MAALGDRGAGAGFGVNPRENEEGRGGEAAPRSGAKRRPDFWRAALVPLAVSLGVNYRDCEAALGGRAAGTGFGVKPERQQPGEVALAIRKAFG
ncbi:MAG TPA: hypothetical protein VKP30_11955, partial [Polyangiaceae bacterium]|nr:hypothetical protein [Polyangiaceae bacterium]